MIEAQYEFILWLNEPQCIVGMLTKQLQLQKQCFPGMGTCFLAHSVLICSLEHVFVSALPSAVKASKFPPLSLLSIHTSHCSSQNQFPSHGDVALLILSNNDGILNHLFDI